MPSIEDDLTALDAALHGAPAAELLRLQRRVMAALPALPAGSAARARAELRTLSAQVALARRAADLPAQAAALERALAHALAHAGVLPLAERAPAVADSVDLLAEAGLRTLAAAIARRMARRGAAEARAGCEVDFLVQAQWAAVDLPGEMAQALRLDLPRVVEDTLAADAPAPGALQRAATLQHLADAAGARGRPRAARQARVLAAVFRWLGHDLAGPALLAEAQAFQDWAAQQGLAMLAGPSERLCAWARLTHQRAGPSPAATGGEHADALYLLAAQRLASGHQEQVLRAYAAYARLAANVASQAEHLLALGLHAGADLLVLLPAGHPEPPGGAVARAMVRETLRLHHRFGADVPLQQIAAEQHLTPRRLQQACKTLGLPSPKGLLAGLEV